MQKTQVREEIKINSPRNKSVTASKKTYERLWQFVFLIVSIASAVLFNKIYEYQTYKIFDNTRKGQIMNLILYGLPFAVLFTIFDFGVHYIFDDLCEKHFINTLNYTDPIARKNRCYTLVKWGYSVFYYGLSSLAALLLLKNTSYYPSFLGGSGSPQNIFNDFPENSQFSIQIEVFYILQFGKHFSRTFTHLFIRAQGNFYEFALHHALSILLITFSYTMDQWLIGTFVLFIHDCTDLTLILARAYRDFKFKSQKVLKALYAIGFTTWIFCRIFLFSYALIYSYWTSIFYVLVPKFNQLDPQFYNTMYLPTCLMGSMLSVLQGLQLFWTYYILKSYISVTVSSKLAKHTYD